MLIDNDNLRIFAAQVLFIFPTSYSSMVVEVIMGGHLYRHSTKCVISYHWAT